MATSLAFSLSTLPSGLYFAVNTHLQPTTFFPAGRDVRSQVSFQNKAAISSCMAAIQLESLLASSYVEGIEIGDWILLKEAIGRGLPDAAPAGKLVMSSTGRGMKLLLTSVDLWKKLKGRHGSGIGKRVIRWNTNKRCLQWNRKRGGGAAKHDQMESKRVCPKNVTSAETITRLSLS